MKIIKSKIFWILIGGLIIRFLLSFFGTLPLDQNTFIAWSSDLARDGFKTFYNSWSDYLPGYLYVLWGLGKINLLGIFPQVLLYKLPAIISDLLTGLLIYKILRKSKNEKWGVIGAAIYLFNPAVLGNSALWGQVDSLTALCAVFSIYYLPSSILLSALSLSVGTLIKPQTAFIFPVILFLMLREKRKVKKIFAYLLIGLFTFIAGFIPFRNHGNLVSFIYERLGVSLNQYPYTSVNAFNFWGLIGFWNPDTIYFQIGGYALVLLAFLFLCFKLWKKKTAPYYLASFIFGASFIFFTRMHERHLLPIFAPLAIVAVENPILLLPYLGFSLIYCANLYYSYIWITNDFKEVFSDFLVKFFSLINISMVIAVFYFSIAKLKIGWKRIILLIGKFINHKGQKMREFSFPKTKLSKKSYKIILTAILTFAFITRVFDLKSPPNEYFDEVYHAFTAKVMIHLDANKAWEWWNTPPEGFAYEWTHPPLAKLGMALGMKIFGENSFGWRFPGAVLGTVSVFLIYLLGKHLFKDEAIGLLSAGVFSLDGLPLVMSRIGMNDSYLLCFTLLSIYLFLHKRNFLSALVFGLAIASKWSAIWAVPILGMIWLKRKKKFELSNLWFFILPFGIYLLAYTQMFLTGHGLSVWWEMQKQMWWYHTGLRATHPYTSQWWSWPLLIRPIYLFTSDEVSGTVSRIYAFGNPFVFWFGFFSIIMSFIFSFVER
ncbi:MAG: Glycosyl transferase family 39, partial [Candidatus Woesebacteria bacterium GW2011_GWB1_38_8]